MKIREYSKTMLNSSLITVIPIAATFICCFPSFAGNKPFQNLSSLSTARYSSALTSKVLGASSYDTVRSKTILGNNTSVAILKNKTNPVGLLGKQPPPGFVYLTFTIAALGLLFNFVGFIVKRFDRLVDRIYVMKQEYWTKTFLIPVCLEPMREFVLENSEKLYTLSLASTRQLELLRKKPYADYEAQFRSHKARLINQFLILNAFNAEVYVQISYKIDELEDIVVKHCYANAHNVQADDEYYEFKFIEPVVKTMYNTLSEILMIISANHDNLYIDQKATQQFLIEQIRKLQV